MRCKPPLKTIDMIGKTCGRLTVIKRVPNKGKNARWGCICSCGEYVEVDGCHLRNGGVKSCGCILKEAKWNKTHGLSNSRIYGIWHGMKRRCDSRNKNYGGRGITVCNEWKNSFDTFYEWALNNGYNETLTIDRIDVNGNYCPENCRWATITEQQNNKRTNVIIEYDGVSHTVSEWAKILNIKRETLVKRLKTKSVEESFTKDINLRKSHKKHIEVRGME